MILRDDRNSQPAGDALKIVEHALIVRRRLIVRRDHDGIGAEGFGHLAQMQSGARAAVAGADDDR